MAQQQLEIGTAALQEHALGWHADGWSDFELHLVVPGRVIVKKNHLKPIQYGGRASIAKDAEYTRWEREACDHMSDQWAAVFAEPIPKHVELNFCVLAYLENRRGWPDLTGIYEGPQDVCEKHHARCELRPMKSGRRVGRPKCSRHAGVLTNDRQVRGHVGSDIRVDAHNPRTEIIITPWWRIEANLTAAIREARGA